MTKIKRGIADIDTALRIYYQYPEITNKEISELFGGLSRASALAYKRRVQDEQAKRDIKTHQKFAVNTVVAYEVFGIDIDDLERRKAKLKKLGFVK